MIGSPYKLVCKKRRIKKVILSIIRVRIDINILTANHEKVSYKY